MGQLCSTSPALPVLLPDESNDVEVGRAESLVLEHAPREPWPEASVEALREEGVVLISNVISATAAATLRDYLQSKVATYRSAIALGAAKESDLFHHVKSGGRIVITLELEPVVVDVVAEALRALNPFIRSVLNVGKPLVAGCDEPMLAELAAICPTMGAQRQPIHADGNASCSGPPGRLTTLVALQDIDENMGPTTFLPGTHADPEAHSARRSPTKKVDLLRKGPIRLAAMTAGSGVLYNINTLHAGGANISCVDRWCLALSFVPAYFDISAIDYYSEMCKLGLHSVTDLEQGVLRSQDDDETKNLKAQWTSLLNDEDIRRYKQIWDVWNPKY